MLSQEAADDAYCDALGSALEKFKNCCHYPNFEISNEEWEECEEKHPKDYDQEDFDICPFEMCVYSSYAIITRDANGNITSTEPDSIAILKSFMSSVVNDSSLWEPVMKNVVTRCNDQFGGPLGRSSCGIPDNLFEVIHCTYKQEILQCPDWNYKRLPNCSYNYEWVSKCF